jgi:hypothetical protein
VAFPAFISKEHADNFMMHLLVGMWRLGGIMYEAQGLTGKYGVSAKAPVDKPWGIRDFVITDPTGVLWRIGQNIEPGGKRRSAPL